MDNFEKIIKQKVEQFNVPYNDAHWAEMEGRLNAIRAAKIRNTIFSAVGIIAVVAISYFALSDKNDKETTSQNNTTVVANNNAPVVLSNNNQNNSSEEKIQSADQATKNNVVQDQNNITEENNEGELTVHENNINNNVSDDNNKITEDDNNKISNPVDVRIPDAQFIAFNNHICLGEEVSFEALEKDLPVSYEWDFGDGTTSNKANPKHKYTEAGNFDVSLTLIDRQTGKSASAEQKNVVIISAMPDAEFTYSETSLQHDNNYLKYPYTIFNVKEKENGTIYKWLFDNVEASSFSDTKTIFKEAGTHTVTLSAKNNKGCFSFTEQKINIINSITLNAPTAFNPNSNIAENETFIPKALLGWDVEFKMTIIDKSSNIIYQTSDKNEPWNGKMNNTGELLMPGLYFWEVITYDIENIQHRYHGTITLVK